MGHGWKMLFPKGPDLLFSRLMLVDGLHGNVRILCNMQERMYHLNNSTASTQGVGEACGQAHTGKAGREDENQLLETPPSS